MRLRTSLFPICAISALALPQGLTANSGGYSLLGDGGFFHQAALGQPERRDSTRLSPGGRNTSTSELSPSNISPTNVGRGAVSLRPGAASLFRDRNEGSLFHVAPVVTFDVAGIMDFIASAEAGAADYDAVQYGARIKTPKPPTQMTVGEINAWIDATPGQPHAIGRYQFIPATLRRLVAFQGVQPHERFSPALQDQLAHQLIEEAGLSAHRAGEMTQIAFMNNLAKIWAGLPNSSGKSHYHNYAGNRATVTWDAFKSEMDRIFSG